MTAVPSPYGDLKEFMGKPRPHGRLRPETGELTPNGYRLTVACACGVTFERWVLPQDARRGPPLRPSGGTELRTTPAAREAPNEIGAAAFGSKTP